MSKNNSRLYRADNHHNNPLLLHFEGNGLFSNLINGGNPAYIDQKDIHEAGRVHVFQKDELESGEYKKSHFLSFTSDIDVAYKYLSGRNKKPIYKAKKTGATHYIFELDISNMDDTVISGIYELDYQCLHVKGKKGWMLCEKCANDRKGHKLQIINVVELLKSERGFKRFHKALDNALRDSEWLVRSLDPMPHPGKGYSARIRESDILNVRYYKRFEYDMSELR